MEKDQSPSELLQEKWDPVLSNDRVEGIADPYRRAVTAQLLENQEKFLNEAANVTADVAGFVPTVISMVRRMAPKLIAFDVAGLQPLTMPNGRIFAIRSRYNPEVTPAKPIREQPEALYNEADTSYSGTGSHEKDDPFHVDFSTGTGKDTAAGESDPWASMGLSIEAVDVSVKTRQLRADYSLELAQDMRAVHGLDADNELSAILANQVTAEINREVIRTIYGISKQGAQFTTTPGTFDMTADADGRWSGERYTNLLYAMERDANAVAYETKMGKGNILIVSADLASALAMAGLLQYTTALKEVINMEVDTTGPTFAGTAGRFRVFIDPYLSTNGYVVGYRGANQYDAGFFYCPYVPLQMVRATDPKNFQPAIGYKTRYGLVQNPFTTMEAGKNVYYRKAKVTNLR
jgi:hypothetical protein